jgi:hypothetical protein
MFYSKKTMILHSKNNVTHFHFVSNYDSFSSLLMECVVIKRGNVMKIKQ